MNLLTIFIGMVLIATAIIFRKQLQKTAFALIWAYANHWSNWVKKVEDEYDLSCKRNVLKRRQ